MTNHVRLLLTQSESEAVARLMIPLGRRNVQYINKTYRSTGTLWDSRYKSSLVQADAYLLLCQRYIELNPVRAGMVDGSKESASHYFRQAVAERRCVVRFLRQVALMPSIRIVLPEVRPMALRHS